MKVHGGRASPQISFRLSISRLDVPNEEGRTALMIACRQTNASLAPTLPAAPPRPAALPPDMAWLSSKVQLKISATGAVDAAGGLVVDIATT